MMMMMGEELMDNSIFNRKSLWDEIVTDLQSSGVAIIEYLPFKVADIHRRGFAVARHALDHVRREGNIRCVPWIDPGADSAHVTGYHPANDPKSGMSRYNAYREGFVFSDGNVFNVEGVPDFQPTAKAMFDSLHAIASCVLQAIDRKLELPSGWLQENLGPTCDHSQWHIKRYVVEESVATSHAATTVDDASVLLPMHTDPSLISVIVHDKLGKKSGAMGLEYHDRNHGWIPVGSHGHQVATIFVGSVLSYLTGGMWPSAKHRVVQVDETDNYDETLGQRLKLRMAATLFVRPQTTAMLCVPPSPHLAHVSLKKQINFETWNARVARNYERKKKVDEQQRLLASSTDLTQGAAVTNDQGFPVESFAT
jgi:isopenicillin N synthase-like dioxygenase